MHILVFGGTGACGQLFIAEALHAGHKLTLYARSPSKFAHDISNSENVHIVEGKLSDVPSLTETLHRELEVVVSFLGPDIPAKGMTLTEFYERFCPLLSGSSVRRFLVLSTASYKVQEDRNTFIWWLGIWFIRLFAGTAYQEINGISKAVASLSSDEVGWTLFRVPVLDNKEAKPVRGSYLGDGTDGMFLSRKSIAMWVLCELKEKKWVGKAPALSNSGWF